MVASRMMHRRQMFLNGRKVFEVVNYEVLSYQLPASRVFSLTHYLSAIRYQYLRKREGTPGFPCVRMSDAENRGWG